MSAPHTFAPPATPARWLRAKQFTVEHIDLFAEIDPKNPQVEGRVEHRCRWIGTAREHALFDAHEVEILAATVNGQAVEIRVGEGTVQVAIAASAASAASASSAASAQVFRVAFQFRTLQPRKGLVFTPATATHGPIVWSQGAMEDHSWWFPCWDSPNNRSTWTVTLRHPDGSAGLSNGVRTACVSEAGWTTSSYELKRPTVLYLLTVVVGDLVAVADPEAGVPCAHWVPRGAEASAIPTCRATGFAIAWLAEFLRTPFAWPCYGHAVAPDFWWGGMENATLTTIAARALCDAETQQRDDVDADALIIHELVHQWFGDLVTMQGWSDIWLNESFATWLEARCLSAWREHQCRGPAADHLALALDDNRTAWLEQDARRYRRSLTTNRWHDSYELFDRVAYEYGSLVLEHLCQTLGEAAMRDALALYLQRHGDGVVSTSDLRRAIEDATGQPCDDFLAQWAVRDDHPILKTHWSSDADALTFSIEQTQDGEPFRVPTQLMWRDARGVQVRPIVIEQRHQHVRCASDGSVAWAVIDAHGVLPVEWSDQDTAGSARSRLADAECPAAARARAAQRLGALSGSAADIQALSAAAHNAPELVRRHAIAALAALDRPQAREILLALSRLPEPRLRRCVATAMAVRVRDPAEAQRIAQRLVDLADAESSPVCAGSWLAARGAVRHPGALAELRARWNRPSWNHRLRIGAIHGMGASCEAAAVDDLLLVLSDAAQPITVSAAVPAALATLASHHPLAAQRIRQALADGLHHAHLSVRAASAKALGSIADPADVAVLRSAGQREALGNVARVMREAAELCQRASDRSAAHSDLRRRLDELEKSNERLAARIAALESSRTDYA